MGFIRVRLFSHTLRQHTSLSIALPDGLPTAADGWPLLYLLHGGTEDSTIWFREARVLPIAERYGLVIVSIDAMSSSYADMRHGLPYYTYLTEELPRILRARLPISGRREKTLIGGLSMGGNGALKAAFRRPGAYGACIAISGARDMVPLFEQWAAMEGGPDLRGVEDALGPISQLRGSLDDIVALAEQASKAKADLPRLFLSCGLQDYAAQLSEDYHRHLLKLGIAHDYFTAPGTHSYTFGEKALLHALDLLGKEAGLREPVANNQL